MSDKEYRKRKSDRFAKEFLRGEISLHYSSNYLEMSWRLKTLQLKIQTSKSLLKILSGGLSKYNRSINWVWERKENIYSFSKDNTQQT